MPLNKETKSSIKPFDCLQLRDKLFLIVIDYVYRMIMIYFSTLFLIQDTKNMEHHSLAELEKTSLHFNCI